MVSYINVLPTKVDSNYINSHIFFDYKLYENGRPVQGFHILTAIPFSEHLELPPHPLADDCIRQIMETLAEVRQRFHADKLILESWNIWESLYLPRSDDVNNYVLQLANSGISYHNPISYLLYKSGKELPLSSSTLLGVGANDIEWPDLLSGALNSVNCRFNTDHLEPRIYVVTDAQLTQRINLWKSSTKRYYSELASKLRIIDIHNVLKRKISYDGQIPSTIGNKDVLIELINRIDKTFISIFQKQLSPLDIEFIENTIGDGSIIDDDTALANIVKIKDFSMSRLSLRNMVLLYMNKEHLNATIQLFQNRDQDICQAYKHVNGASRTFQALPVSLFFNCDQTISILSGTFEMDISRGDYYRFYFVDHTHNIIIFASFPDKKIYFINTCIGINSQKDGPFEISKRQYGYNIIQFFRNRQLIQISDNFSLHDYPHQYFETLTKVNDFGVYMYSILYFLVVDVPIYFLREDIEHLKKSLSYYMLSGSLPY
jgi:hypothetical protein